MFRFVFFRKFWLLIGMRSSCSICPTAGGTCQKCSTKYYDRVDAPKCTIMGRLSHVPMALLPMQKKVLLFWTDDGKSFCPCTTHSAARVSSSPDRMRWLFSVAFRPPDWRAAASTAVSVACLPRSHHPPSARHIGSNKTKSNKLKEKKSEPLEDLLASPQLKKEGREVTSKSIILSQG